MPDYKELYYKSQAALADVMETLDNLKEQLRWCMMDCEECVISEKSEETTEQGNHI